ncbi:MAG: hypothetical protein RIK87_24850 [Fuerstiella sp.]
MFSVPVEIDTSETQKAQAAVSPFYYGRCSSVKDFRISRFTASFKPDHSAHQQEQNFIPLLPSRNFVRRYWRDPPENDQERFVVACLDTKNRVQSVVDRF